MYFPLYVLFDTIDNKNSCVGYVIKRTSTSYNTESLEFWNLLIKATLQNS